jgi:hypothetical protein
MDFRAVLLSAVPPEVLRKILKKNSKHDPKSLTKDRETLVDEFLRVSDQSTVKTLCEEYAITETLTAWLFIGPDDLSKQSFEKHVRENISSAERAGLRPEDVGETPQLHRAETRTEFDLFYYVAKDQNQKVSVAFGETTKIPILNYYVAVVHFSSPHIIVFGPHTSTKAEAVVQQLAAKLHLDQAWEILKPERGDTRNFYKKVKDSLGAILVETKREDPKGDYQTVALQARRKQYPDLEQVPGFIKRYLKAGSYFDILEYEFTTALGFTETTNVKFGKPLGKFVFRADTPLSGIIHFEKHVRQILK